MDSRSSIPRFNLKSLDFTFCVFYSHYLQICLLLHIFHFIYIFFSPLYFVVCVSLPSRVQWECMGRIFMWGTVIWCWRLVPVKSDCFNIGPVLNELWRHLPVTIRTTTFSVLCSTGPLPSGTLRLCVHALVLCTVCVFCVCVRARLNSLSGQLVSTKLLIPR